MTTSIGSDVGSALRSPRQTFIADGKYQGRAKAANGMSLLLPLADSALFSDATEASADSRDMFCVQTG